MSGLRAVLALAAAILLPVTVRADDPASYDRGGFVVAELRDGTVSRSIGEGAANVEYGQPITTRTVFHIASLSKQITGAALAHAIRDGLVSLGDPVADWIPETAKYGDALTVAHLVYMTSGLTEYTDRPRANGDPWFTFHHFTTDEAIAASLAVPELRFAPGSEWQYTNINYMLIARIVAEAYRRPFADVVAERIFEPLGMTHSLINDDPTAVIPLRADGYVVRNDAVRTELAERGHTSIREGDGPVQIRRVAPHYGGSGVMTSMEDWALWLDEMNTHTVFGDDFWTLMTQTRAFDHDKTNDAFGLYHTEMAGEPGLAYAGGDIDANSYSILLTDAGYGVACFSNDPFENCEQRVHDWLARETR